MSDFPRSPQLLKGALALYEDDTATSDPDVVVFQYNPDKVRRSLTARRPEREGRNQAAPEDVLRVAGPPVETIDLSVVLDAADQLADPDGNRTAAEKGLHPALAALELMMYPSSLDLEQLERQAAAGEVQVQPGDLPLTLLIWGRSRVVPVAVTRFGIAEEAFDTRLNPIRAKVDLALKVLTYLEFPGDSVGRDAFFTYQKRKEELAAEAFGSADKNRIRSLLPARGQT
jgi:hypothetical protein